MIGIHTPLPGLSIYACLPAEGVKGGKDAEGKPVRLFDETKVTAVVILDDKMAENQLVPAWRGFLYISNKVILSRCGINVKGRSGKLRMNYRTTEEIRHRAMNILSGLSFDDLDDGIDDGKGYISVSHGVQPTVTTYATQDQEAAELIKCIQEQISAGIDPREICVVARTNPLVDEYKKYLTASGIECYEIKRRQADDRSRMGVRLATMHRVKGLEFTIVFIVAANKNYIPLKSAVNRTDPMERDAAMTGERCLLYVAMTRAKKMVKISAYGAVSDFLS